jgi:DsbC/DsbD-like thiol-disulfide interchange protein/cytochrome c biogenesis protein CcdA/thiol-disulfide isomerase/thioredoxin
MMNSRFTLLFAFALLLCGRPAGHAQDAAPPVLVTPSLVADTTKIAAGRPFTVGVRMQFAKGWHTYWQHPGESGGAPKIEWQLPAGFTAGPIQWPLPKAHLDEGDLLTYIYEDEVLLPVEITPPALLAAGDLTIKAELKWLVCEATCVPGQGSIELQLPSGDDGVPSNAELFATWRARLPKAEAPPFPITWSRKPDAVVLQTSNVPVGATVEFLPLPPTGVELGHPKLESGAGGSHTITVSVREGGASDLALRGVLVVAEEGRERQGWLISSIPAAPLGGSVAASESPVDSGLAWKLLLAFTGGLIMNVMPCVLPVIALKIFGFVKQAGEEPARVFRLGLAFAAGVFAFFLGLAAIVSQLRGAFNFGYQFQNPWLLTGLIALVFVFALNLLGVFEVELSGGTTTKLSRLSSREGYGGAFLHGLFTTLLGTSCTAPFLGSSLGFAVTQPAPIVFLLFTAIATGMSLPYLLLTARPAWLRFVPKPGLWMERVKQVMGFVMLAVVVWLVGVMGSRGSEASSAVSWFLLALGVACWIYGTFSRSLISWAVIATMVGLGYFSFLRGAFDRPAKQGTSEVEEGWQTFSEERVAAARAAGRPVFIDFTADWCVNCKVYEKTVLHTESIQRAFREKGVVAFKADWTNDDPEVTRALKSYGRNGVPLYVLYRPGGNTPVIHDALTHGLIHSELAPIAPAPPVLSAK